jgi:hypothetical protein
VYNEVVSISFKIGDICLGRSTGEDISRTTSLQSNWIEDTGSWRLFSTIKSTVSIEGDPAGAKRQENLFGVAVEISTTLFSPKAAFAMDLTLYARSAMILPLLSATNLHSYLRTFPISFLALMKVEFPPNKATPHGAWISFVSDAAFHVPENHLSVERIDEGVNEFGIEEWFARPLQMSLTLDRIYQDPPFHTEGARERCSGPGSQVGHFQGWRMEPGRPPRLLVTATTGLLADFPPKCHDENGRRDD